MRPLNQRRLKEYSRRHADAAASLRAWWNIVHGAEWESFSDVRATFNSASYVVPLTVFNIKGNDYRLVTHIDYDRSLVVMRWFGTHAEYDKEEWKK